MTLKAAICAINDGSKTKRTGRAAFCVVDLRECRGLPQKRSKRRTDVQAIFSAPLIDSTELKRRISNMPTATVAAPAAAPAKQAVHQPKALPAPNSDFYELYETLNADELATVKRVRAFMESKVAPVITKYWVEDAFPFELLPAVKELGIGVLAMQGYGCAGGSLLQLGFVQMKLARVDPSFSTFIGVHVGLAMGSIYIDGSEEQKQKWLPPMARFEKIGCFGLTEPLVGSGASGGLTTTAKREGDTWVLHRREQNHAWLQGREDPEQDRAQDRSERPDHDGELPGPRGEPSSGRQLVPRHREGVENDALSCGVGGDRMRDGRLRERAQILPGAIAIRKADRLVSTRAGPSGQNAREHHRFVMHVGSLGSITGRRQADGRSRGAVQGVHHGQMPRDRRVGSGTVGRQRHRCRLQRGAFLCGCRGALFLRR